VAAASRCPCWERASGDEGRGGGRRRRRRPRPRPRRGRGSRDKSEERARQTRGGRAGAVEGGRGSGAEAAWMVASVERVLSRSAEVRRQHAWASTSWRPQPPPVTAPSFRRQRRRRHPKQGCQQPSTAFVLERATSRARGQTDRRGHVLSERNGIEVHTACAPVGQHRPWPAPGLWMAAPGDLLARIAPWRVGDGGLSIELLDFEEHVDPSSRARASWSLRRAGQAPAGSCQDYGGRAALVLAEAFLPPAYSSTPSLLPPSPYHLPHRQHAIAPLGSRPGPFVRPWRHDASPAHFGAEASVSVCDLQEKFRPAIHEFPRVIATTQKLLQASEWPGSRLSLPLACSVANRFQPAS